MAKTFLTTVRAMLPYPVIKEYRIEASGIATAANRGIKLFRKDKPGKKIDEISVTVKYLKGIL